MMIKLAPFFLLILYSVGEMLFSNAQLTKNLRENSTPLDDPKIREFLDKIAKSLGLRKIIVRIHQSDEVNGLATSAGDIFLTRGMMAKYEQGVFGADEISSVIAHELGHVALGHVRKRMIAFGLGNVIARLPAIFLGRVSSRLGDALSAALQRLFFAQMSRQNEFEADAYAAAVLIKSDIGAQSLVKMFQTLSRLHSGRGEALSWLSNHPKLSDRISAVEELQEKWSSAGN